MQTKRAWVRPWSRRLVLHPLAWFDFPVFLSHARASDGVERLGAELARERVRWVSAIWYVFI